MTTNSEKLLSRSGKLEDLQDRGGNNFVRSHDSLLEYRWITLTFTQIVFFLSEFIYDFS